MKVKKFVVLIGSLARGDDTAQSDIDIVEIGEPFDYEPSPTEVEGRRITKIQYTYKRFRDLYKRGGLFWFHVFREGRLLEGDKVAWRNFAKGFVLKKSFAKEIRASRLMIEYLIDDEMNVAAPVAFLSNVYRGLKQIAICRLAERGEYEFNKRKAVEKFYNWLTPELIKAMGEAEYVMSRGGRGTKKLNFPHHSAMLFKLCRAHQSELS